ncbi:hypothetical protein WJX82_007633 [Trebouxia sp. C0006]
MAPKAVYQLAQSASHLATAKAEEKLFGAVADLDLIQVKELLSQGISANAKWVQAYVAPGRYFGKGSTPLHEAAAAGHQGIMDALLASQANLAIQDHQGRMPLHRAIASGQLQMVRYCLSKQNLPEIDGQNLGQPCVSCLACRVEDPQLCKDILEELLAAGACINGMSSNGETCLHAAASWDNVVAANWLLLHGADVAAQDKKGWTSLHNAIDSGSAQTARALLAHGADANLEFPECKDDSCEKQGSLLYESAKEGRMMCVKALLASGALTTFQYKGNFPIKAAIGNSHWSVVEAFLSHYKEHPPAADSKECNFEKVLCSAMLEGESHIVHRFLSCTGLSRDLDLSGVLGSFLENHFNVDDWPTLKIVLPHCKDPSQLASFLCSVAVQGSAHLIETLLLYGADVNDVNPNERTALYKGASKGHLDVVDKLLSCGADPNICGDVYISGHGCKGKTALDVSGDGEVIEYLREYMSAQQGRPDCATQQHKAQVCKVSLQNKEATAAAAVQQMSADKQSAEQAVIDLLKQAKSKTEKKIDMCEQRHQQKGQLSLLLSSMDANGPNMQNGDQSLVPSVEATVRSNDEQLAACKKLVLAFRATQDARAQLQRCLNQEQALLQESMDPLKQCVTNSRQLINATAERLQSSDPAREKRHAEMLIRDLNKQLGDAQHLQQLKLDAQAVIMDTREQEDTQRALKRKLIRAKADLEVLLLDDKQSQADRVQVEIDETTAKLAEVAGRVAAAAETVSAAIVHHPELQWEQAASAMMLPKLGAAKDLFDKDKRLRDFNVIARHGLSVREVEDLGKHKWAIKGIDSGANAAREAERLCKLRGHPLIVSLSSTFMDADRLYLQMPFYQNGNLRKWVEQIKATRQHNGTLSPLEKAAVRTTMRQVAQAISYTHQQGIVHRDIKPENVLLQDNGNIALCDFGISKDIISNKYESTMMLSAVGTAAYCAPEAGSDAWRQHASAVDAWSFGIMLLELGAGYLFSWVAPIGKIAFQPGRLDAAVPLSREALPANDDWFQALWEVAMQLLNAKPQNRPSMSVALLSDFFTSDQLSLEVTPTDRKFRTLNSHLDALRHSHTRLPARLIAIQSEATALTDMLTSFSATDLALPKALSVSWGASGMPTRMVRQYLVEDRRPALEAVAQGFRSLDLADHLEHFSGVELAALFCGEQYVDVDSLIQCFRFDDEQQDTAATKGFLETFIRSLSESSIRVFLARVTNQLSLPRTDAQQGQRLTQAEEQAVVAAMRGEIRAGGYYRCVCGYIYTVGECGGPMERAACPRCGHAIGGQQHRLEGGNAHVAFDGANAAAWPQ